MKNLGTLYRYELFKIFRKKMVWITGVLLLLVTVFSMAVESFGDYYVDGVRIASNYEMMQTDRAYEEALTGRAIDQTLLTEMQEGYEKIPKDVEHYSLTEEYQRYARPYSAVFNFVREAAGMTVSEAMDWQADESGLGALRKEKLADDWQDYLLTAEEKEFWENQDKKIEFPLTFAYDGGWEMLYLSLYTIGLMCLIAVAISLSGVFAEEHNRKTDQLILCSRYGRRPVYLAKMLAGMTAALILSLVYTLTAYGTAAAVYGIAGGSAAFQLIRPTYSYPLSNWQAVGICYCMVVLASVLTGIFVMLLSELLRSGVSTLALTMGIMIFTMFFNMPEQYRALYQLFGYLPSELVTVWNIFSVQTVPVFGTYLTAWQAAPILYLAVGAAMLFLGEHAYRRYQVSGR